VRPAAISPRSSGASHLATEGEAARPSRHDVVLAESFNEAAGAADSARDIAWLAETSPAIRRPRTRAPARSVRLHGALFRNGARRRRDHQRGAWLFFGSFGALMLTIDAHRHPDAVALHRPARQADALTSLDFRRRHIAIGQFQAAVGAHRAAVTCAD